MTDSQPQNASGSVSPRIGLPGIAAIFFTLTPILLILGWMIFMGTSSRDFFSGAPFQAMLGTFLILIGLLCLFSALLLVGVRVITQQHLNVLVQLSSPRPE